MARSQKSEVRIQSAIRNRSAERSRSPQSEIMEWLKSATERLTQVGIGPEARSEAEWLLAHVLKVERWKLSIEESLSSLAVETAECLLERRLSREPLAYVLGEWAFGEWTIEVSPAVLIPRPETEMLVEQWCQRFRGKGERVRILDMGTGSGCFAIAAAHFFPRAVIDAVDVSPEALQVAGRNFRRYGLEGRVRLREGSLWKAVEPEARYHGILANLPYIPSLVIPDLEPEVLAEPAVALDGGADGLELIRAFAKGLPQHVHPGAVVGLEIGGDQGSRVADILTAAGLQEMEVLKDLQGFDRYVLGEFGG